MSLPLLLSLALSPVAHPWLQPLLLVGVFLALELVTVNVIEPILLGHNAGVSPLALLIAAVFWTWLWGPLGLILSTPMTVCLVVLGKYVPQLHLFNVLMGPACLARAETSYYQRLLVHDEDEATDLVQAYLKTHPVEQVYDELLLPALVMTGRDHERGSLEPADQRVRARGHEPRSGTDHWAGRRRHGRSRAGKRRLRDAKSTAHARLSGPRRGR